MPKLSHLILEMNNVENAPCLIPAPPPPTPAPLLWRTDQDPMEVLFYMDLGGIKGYPDCNLKDKGARKWPRGIRLLGNSRSILIISTDFGVSLKQFYHLLSHVEQHI